VTAHKRAFTAGLARYGATFWWVAVSVSESRRRIEISGGFSPRCSRDGVGVRDRKDLGERKNVRVEYGRAGFLIPAPDAPWLECFIVDVSDTGICLDVGALAVPKIFGVAFNSSGSILRVCSIAWRRGELIGASFLSAKELRQGEQKYSDPRLQKQPAT
jgi:hypothetical protein